MRNSVFFLACTIMLFGCGGNDTKSPSDTTSSASGIVYTGKTTAADITANNAVSLTGVVVQGTGSGAKIGASFRVRKGKTHTSSVALATQIVAVAQSALNAKAGGQLVAAGAVQNQSQTLNGADLGAGGQGTAVIKIQIDGVTGLGTMSVTYSNYGVPPEIMNGNMSINITAVDSVTKNPTGMSIQFDNFTISDAVGINSMNGTIGLSRVANSNTDTLTMTFVMKDSSGNITKVDNIKYIAVDDGFGNIVSEDMSGRVYDSAYGYVDIVTNSPLMYTPAGSMYPSSGGSVIFTGASNKKVRVTPVDAINVLVEADTTGDGNYDYSKQVAWSSL